MKIVNKQTAKVPVTNGRQRSYNEIVEFLDKNWATNKNDTSLTNIKNVDKALGNPSQKVNTVLVGGTNGKSLTINFAAKLLRSEGLSVGTFYAPHILTYNERFVLNNEAISNKTFTDVANEVINTAEVAGAELNTFEVLTLMALSFFEQSNVDVALLEVTEGGVHNATSICTPKIAAITRVTEDHTAPSTQAATEVIKDMTGIVKAGTHVISADQSKLNLQVMLDEVTARGGVWEMPIRKLASLPYPYEQLHGRCSALAERIAYIFINMFANKDAIVVSNSLLTKKKGQRGRPTLEAKRQSKLNPTRTVEQFWKEQTTTLPGRFQLMDKEKPSLLLDNASNLDAFENLLLGIRLLHYDRPLKGLTLVLGCDNEKLDMTEFLKLLRYFFKKTSGQVIVCPVSDLPGTRGTASWDAEKVANDIKSMKIKARSASSFKAAFEMAQQSVDERNGLVVISGSNAILNEFWRYKGLKKV